MLGLHGLPYSRPSGKLGGLLGLQQYVAMLSGGSPGSTLGNLAGVIKPSRVVLAVLFGFVQASGMDDSHLLISL